MGGGDLAETGKSTVRAGEECVLQHVAVCVLQCVALRVSLERALYEQPLVRTQRCSVLQCVAVCCRVLQSVAVCCSVL